MARFLPPEFPVRDFRRGEQAVWDALEAQLPGDAAVFHSLRLPEGRSEREIDVVVALPGRGLAVLEFKGGASNVMALAASTGCRATSAEHSR